MKKRVLGALLSVAMLIGLLPTMAFAAYTGNANPIIDSATVVWKDNKNQVKLVMSTNYANGQELHVGVINETWFNAGLCDPAPISGIRDSVENNALGVYVNIPANAANKQGGTVYADLLSLPKGDDGTSVMVNGKVKILVWSSGTGTGNWNLSSASDAAVIADGKGEVTKEDPTKDLYKIGAAKTYTGSALNPEITPGANAGAVTNIYLADNASGTNKTAANAGKVPAGTYHVFVDVAASTLYNAKTDLYLGTWTISKASQTAPTLTKNDMDADGNGGKITITNYAAGKTYEIKGPGATDYTDATLTNTNEIAVTTDGKYSVRVKGDANYEASPAAEVTIKQAGAAAAELADKTVTYNGSAQSVTVKVTQDGADKTGEYTVYYTGKDGTTYGESDTAPTNAGTYTVTVKKTVGGTALPQTATLTIEKAPVTVAFSEASAGKTLAEVKKELSGVIAADTADVTLDLTWTDDETTAIVAGQEYTWTGTLKGTKAGNYELEITPLKINAAGSGIVIGGSKQTYTVTYNVGSHGNFSSDASTTEKVAKNETPKNVPVVHPHDNYRFMGWTLDGKTVVDPTTQKITKNVTFTALYEACDHMAYMVGRSDTQFAPNGNLTRAEAATILSRLTEGFDENGTYPAAPYSDLNTAAWYAKYVNFAASKGIVNGRPDGTFDPDASITRAEFATMIANFAGVGRVEAPSASNDVAGHWAAGYIVALERANIVTGYEDGTFRPNANITRAEAATMVNGAIDRTPDTALDLAANSYTNPFTDVTAGQWFFAQVMEATVNHVTAHFHTEK